MLPSLCISQAFLYLVLYEENISFLFLFQCCILSVLAQTNVIWKIGKEDGRGAE